MFEAVAGYNKSLVEQVSDQIASMIADQNLAIGQKLPNEFELAETFRVGRGTVREAVKLLVSRNILEIRRGKGTFVSPAPGIVEDPLGLTFYQDKYKLALDLIEIRCILEPKIAALAATHANKGQIEEMWRLCLEAERCAAKGESYIQCDIDLHICIAQSTGNLVMPNLIPIISSGIELFNEFPYQAERMDALRVHRDLLEAIELGKPQEAEETMTRHLSYNIRHLRTFKDKYEADSPK